jgi:hypothetical protein
VLVVWESRFLFVLWGGWMVYDFEGAWEIGK